MSSIIMTSTTAETAETAVQAVIQAIGTVQTQATQTAKSLRLAAKIDQDDRLETGLFAEWAKPLRHMGEPSDQLEALKADLARLVLALIADNPPDGIEPILVRKEG